MLADWGCDYLQGDLIGLAAIERPWQGGAPEPRRDRARLLLAAAQLSDMQKKVDKLSSGEK